MGPRWAGTESSEPPQSQRNIGHDIISKIIRRENVIEGIYSEAVSHAHLPDASLDAVFVSDFSLETLSVL